MAKISHNFLSDAPVDSLFTNTLRMVGEFMGIAQVLLFKVEDNGSTLVCQSEWLNPELNLNTRINNKFDLPEPTLSIINNLHTGDGGCCLRSNDLACDEEMKSYRVNFQNYIIAPIFVKGKLRAILDFSAVLVSGLPCPSVLPK